MTISLYDKPMTEWTKGDLRRTLDRLHEDRQRYDRANRIVEVRSCDLEIAEATRALAIINRRATEAEDQRPVCGITQMHVDSLLTTLRLRGLPEAHAVVTNMWTALQTMQAQRGADLREAFIAGVERAMGAAFLDQRGQDVGAQIYGPTPGDVDHLAAEYARSKAGG